jgi:hypothetical protein
MNKLMKILMLIISIPLLASIGGCVSSGDIKNPLTPIGTLKDTNKGTATVYFYRSSDHFGIFQLVDFGVLIDTKFKWELPSEDTDISNKMVTNRSTYMTKELEPGVHNFYHGELFSNVVADLEAGRAYYLAVAFHVGGISSLEFRTRDNFLAETKDSKLMEWTGKCSSDKGCPRRLVNE